jgi:hypothetical protein
VRFKDRFGRRLIGRSLVKEQGKVTLVPVDGLNHEADRQRSKAIHRFAHMIDRGGNIAAGINQGAIHIKNYDLQSIVLCPCFAL